MLSVLCKAFLLDESSSHRDEFLWKLSICAPESVPLGRAFPLKGVPLIEILLLCLLQYTSSPLLSSRTPVSLDVQVLWVAGPQFEVLIYEGLIVVKILHGGDDLHISCGYSQMPFEQACL